ncbi:MAG: hypothetical protein DI623_02210 [Sphingomonas sanxanigenens]|uniref:Uncharacterized protein n=1 Tax=Sphingomonas sanxanigenens TaxID=397260 RepID=A0A2W5CBM5_9SPHN|nr:MAG: hypothetical protein DI623_02210 [Sphingomonas sanxanigenens]
MAQFLKRLFCSLRGHPGHYAEAEHLQFYACHCPNCGAQFERMELAQEMLPSAPAAGQPVGNVDARALRPRQPAAAPALARSDVLQTRGR